MSDTTKPKTGTREWSEHSVNIGTGCGNNCLYCYARAMAVRFGRRTHSDWKYEAVNERLPSTKKRDGVIMFPTTHDITPAYLPTALTFLQKLLEHGNKVLIVSKPHFCCISELCDRLRGYKGQILFRFTIGSLDEKLRALWEPGAPPMSERTQCLRYAFAKDFNTSVSMEPMLGSIQDAKDTFYELLPWVSDTIWIGKMNKVRQRVPQTTDVIKAACSTIEALQSDENIMILHNRLKDEPKVRWKDSIQEVIRKHQ